MELRFVWAEGQLAFGNANSKKHHRDILKQMIENGLIKDRVQNYIAGDFSTDDFHGPQFDHIHVVWQAGQHPTTEELRYLIQQELQRTGRLDMNRTAVNRLAIPMVQKLNDGDWQRQWTSATSEDTEPSGASVGFLHDPHKELYPNLFRGAEKIPGDVREALKNHVLDPLSQEFVNPDKFIYFTIYGSGISYNWDESGDLDLQLWVDSEKYANTTNVPMDMDDLIATIRRIVQPINFPSFNDLDLSETGETEEVATGAMLIQYYPKPGTGSKEENLASQPYACYDMETDEWLVKPKPIKPRFYGQNFLLLMPKAKDIALQAEALLGEYQRDVLNFQFWFALYQRYHNKEYKQQYTEAMQNATQEKEGIKTLFQGVFGGRSEAYSPEGKGIYDERDILQKLLEVWGTFQDLKHFARAPLPWEEQELPLPTSKWSMAHPNLTLIPGGGQGMNYTRGSMVTGRPGTRREGMHGYIVTEPTPDDDMYGVQWYPLDSDMEFWREEDLLPWGWGGPRAAGIGTDIKEHGGGTFINYTPADKTDGYWVSLEGRERQVDEEWFNTAEVQQYLHNVPMLPGEYLGAWIDAGKVYLDATVWIPDLQDAVRKGLENGQRAIWDIKNSTEIRLDNDKDEVDFVPVMAKIIKQAVWSDIMEKAQRLRDEGKVQIQLNDPNHVVGQVQGDHGTYETEIWRDDPNSGTITLWNCDCPWSQYSWGRTRQWKKYEGRPCAHTLALYWTSLASPVQQPGQQVIPGFPQQQQQPSPVNLPEALRQTVQPPTPGSQPQPALTPNQQGEQITIHFPGALSKWRKEGQFMNGDIVRTNGRVEGWDDRGGHYVVPRNSIGEVIWSDEQETIAIFSTEAGKLGVHNIKVQAPTSIFTLMPRTRGVAPRRRR